MKPVLDWMKKNLVVVICGAVILISLPVAWFFSSSMNSTLQKKQQTDGEAKLKEVTGKREINYTVLIPEPGRDPKAEKAAPNDERIKAYAELKQRVDAQAAEVVKRAEAFNRGEGPDAAGVGRTPFTPLLDGIFPGPANSDDLEIKLREFEDILVGKRGPTPYDAILGALQAGTPPDPATLGQALAGQRQREIEKTRAGTRELTKDEQAKIDEFMGLQRLATYQGAARNFSVYASVASLPQDINFGRIVPTATFFRKTGYDASPQPVRHMEDFLYQWDLWVLADTLNAVRLANTTPDGRLARIPDAVVKRIESMRLADPKGVYGAAEAVPAEMAGMPGAATGPVAGVNGLAPFDPAASITGRISASTNELYDLRELELKVVVSSRRLPELLDAITRTNFMTVIDLDMQEADVAGDLAKGYFYGDEHVVRATLRIESVWLRTWTAGLMPKQLRAQLGIKLPSDDAQPAADGSVPADGQPGSPQPASPAGPQPVGRPGSRPPG